MNLGSDKTASKAKVALREGRQLLNSAHYDEAEQALRKAADLARAANDMQMLRQISTLLERFCAYDVVWEGHSSIEDPGGLDLPDWKGESLSGRNLLIRRRWRDPGAEIRLGRLAELAGRQAGLAVAQVDPRLVPLFTRSFPSCRFIANDAPLPEGPFDALAGYEILGRYLAPSAESVADQFVPLQPDPERVASLTTAYRAASNGEKVIGVSWHSSNEEKDMPRLDDWAWLFLRIDGMVASLNYGDRSEDFGRLEALTGSAILPDLIDQLTSLDDLSAQICAMDAIVTISNTTAHMVGSLGKPAHLLLTEFSGMTWPVQAQRSPWYPNLDIHRRHNQSWRDLFGALAAQLNATPPV